MVYTYTWATEPIAGQVAAQCDGSFGTVEQLLWQCGACSQHAGWCAAFVGTCFVDTWCEAQWGLVCNW